MRLIGSAFLSCLLAALPALAKSKPARVLINADHVLEIKGKRVYSKHAGETPALPGHVK